MPKKKKIEESYEQVPENPELYLYNATVTRVIDGDTIVVDLDLGMNTIITGLKIRLYEINAPEKRGRWKVKGIESLQFLYDLIEDKNVLIQTIKDKKGKYGRLLGIIYYDNENINQRMVESGHAKYQKY